MALTDAQRERLAALLDTECLICGDPIEREWLSILRCQPCFERWYEARYGCKYERREK